MPIVKWPILIIGKLVDNRPIPIIGAPLVMRVISASEWMHSSGLAIVL